VAVDELAQQAPLVRFEVLTLVRVGVLRAAGFRLEPAGNPRHFTVAFDDLEADIEDLRRCEHRRSPDGSAAKRAAGSDRASRMPSPSPLGAPKAGVVASTGFLPNHPQQVVTGRHRPGGPALESPA